MPTYHDVIPVDWLEPGETTTVEVDGRPYGVANLGDGYSVFEPTCPHQSTQLGGLPLTRKCLIQCPEHGSVFDLRDGSCVLPSNDGWSGQLGVYPTRIEDDVVQVTFDADTD